MKIKKYILTFLAIVACISGVTAYASEYKWIGRNTVLISGESNPNQNVTLQMTYPNKDKQAITPQNISDIVAYQNQITVKSNGIFEFPIELGEQEGRYNVSVYYESSDTTENFTIDNTTKTEVGFSALGHIYYDYSNIPINIDLCIPGVTEYELDFEIKDYSEINNNIVNKHIKLIADDSGMAKTTYKLDLSDSELKYGVFTLNYRITDNYGVAENGTTRFSVLKLNEQGSENPKLGTVQHFFTTHSSVDMRNTLDIMRKAGLSGQRQSIYWSSFEKKKGEYVLTDRNKEFLNLMDEYRLNHMLTLFGTNSLYGSENPPVSTGDGSMLEAFGNYAYNLALETKDTTVYYEIWNEYEIKGSPFNYDNATEEDYVNMLKAVYSRIHQANPNAIVCGVGGPYDWMKRVFELGGGEYIDALVYHCYSKFNTPEYNVDDKIKDVRNAMGEKYANLPILITETGFPSSGKSPDNKITYTPAEQAKREIRNLILLYDYADQIYIYNSMERKDPTSLAESTYGLICENTAQIPYEAKPVLVAISNFNNLLNGAEFTEKQQNGISVKDRTYCYTFKGKDLNTIYAVWKTGDKSEFTLNTGTESVTMYDIFGNSTNMSSDTGIYTFGISDSPVYIETPKNVTVRFTDESAYNLTELHNGKISVNVNVDINDVAYDVFLAMYKKNVLLNCDIMRNDDNSDNYAMDISVDEADKIGVFVWKKDNMSPIAFKILSKKAEE